MALALALSSCSPHPGCDVDDVSEALARVVTVQPDLIDVVDRMQVFCVDDTATLSRCIRDVDACTRWIGSPTTQGRTYAHHRVPVGNAIAHEAEHWRQMADGDCLSHGAECGFDYDRVEAMTP